MCWNTWYYSTKLLALPDSAYLTLLDLPKLFDLLDLPDLTDLLDLPVLLDLQLTVGWVVP